MVPTLSDVRAVRATGEGPEPDELARRARALGVLGWVRTTPGGGLAIHAEGDDDAVAELVGSLGSAELSEVKREGHEQFGIRGVPAGVFVVQEHRATAHHFDFRLELGGVLVSWAIPKGPSLDPGVRRFAVQVEDHDLAHAGHESERVIVWDRGTYEQGGRVAWPEALDRGHAVFVLHGEKLAGGWVLQRTGSADAAKPQWLLLKRRDDDARPGSDIVAERPESVLSGRTLQASPDP